MVLVIVGVHEGVLLQKIRNPEIVDLKSYTRQFRYLTTSGIKSA